MLEERVLTAEDVDAVLELQDRIHREMPHKSWLAQTDRSQFLYMLSGGGYSLGLFDGKHLAGAWMLYYPLERQDNLAEAIGEHPSDVAHFELVMLENAYRGQGVHGKMTKRLVQRLEAEGRFKVLAATVHPDNAASLQGFLKNGFTIWDTRSMYGGVQRCILIKPLQMNRFDIK